MISFSCRRAWPRFVLDASFSAPGGCVALFGPSGSGKSTVAKLIAGIERPDAGRIVVGDHVLFDSEQRIEIPVHKRRVGLVFQDGQLLPHLSVKQNLDYGRYFAPRETAAVASFDAVVELLGIGHLLAARPSTLSGGERQRVAIGRALLAAPRLLVMDEPLASLDFDRKLEILPFIARLRDEIALPIIYVSHSVEEIARLATKVVKMSAGRVVAEGPLAEVFASALPEPAAGRFDAVSFLAGTAVRDMPEFGMTIVSHPAGEISLPARFGALKQPLRISVHATSITLALAKPEGVSTRTILKGRVAAVSAAEDRPTALVTVELVGGDRITASVTRLAVSDLGLAPGREIYALIKAVSVDERIVNVLN
jgi:molybdate transport system ATP-binding protein